MPVDHFSLVVPSSKVAGLVEFLLAALKHLGFKEHIRFHDGQVVGLGESTAYFWVAGCPALEEAEKSLQVLKQQHVAFSARRNKLMYRSPLAVEEVREFHDTAMKAGGTDNGPPGPRAQYHPGYFGAFVRDPHCGVNFEVVMHTHKGEK